LFDDFEAFRFEKNPFEGSRASVGVSVGEDGKGGREVKSGDLGWSSFEICVATGNSLAPSLIDRASRREGDLLLASVGEVMMLLTADVPLGMAKDSEAGLAMFSSFPKLVQSEIETVEAQEWSSKNKSSDHEVARETK